MNNDLISRSALLEKECCGRISGNDVRNAPAVDAEPVRHGRWIENEDTDVYAGFWNCSECGHEIYSDMSLIEELQEQGYALYCQYCGAKMDAQC